MSLENMKVIALGGCGGMGRFAVKTAIDYDFVQKIISSLKPEKTNRKLRSFPACSPMPGG